MEFPSSLTVDSADLTIPQGVLVGIQVHSNTALSSLSMYPPIEGLTVDSTKMMIVGEYSGSWVGVHNITLRASNVFNTIEAVIPFVFTGLCISPSPS